MKQKKPTNFLFYLLKRLLKKNIYWNYCTGGDISEFD